MSVVALKDIARQVGCSRSAVSYALRNSRMISDTLRARIQATARELGWRPDAELARRMALVRQTLLDGERPHLALVINKRFSELTSEHAPRKHLAGARDYAEEKGYHADIFNLAEQPLKPARLRNILHARGIQGIVFLMTLKPRLEDEYLALGDEFACVVAGARPPSAGFHTILNDYHGAGHLGVTRLLEKGYRRIGAVLPRGVDAPLTFAFTGGLTSVPRQRSEPASLPILHTGGRETHIAENTFAEVRSWYAEHEPEAILTTDPDNLTRALADVSPRAEAVPIYSLDFDEGQRCRGGADLRQYQVGRAAVDVVVAQLHRGESGSPEYRRIVQIEPCWAEKASGAGQLPVKRRRTSVVAERCLVSA
ncbi:MAG: LacI family DNA-binding transcriptional regulator [Opitutales bacterium]|nr:LacI family DNA-binding transcriptional regulator [Opitutales bacterium]